MKLSDLIRNPPHAKTKPPQLKWSKKRKRTKGNRYKKPPKRQRKRNLFDATFKDLSDTRLDQAKTIFKTMSPEKSKISIFLFILVDLYAAFPTLPIFENLSWLHGLWDDGINSIADGNSGILLENKMIWNRCSILSEESEHMSVEGIPLEAGAHPNILQREVTSLDCTIDTVDLDKVPSYEKKAFNFRRNTQTGGAELVVLENGGMNWQITNAHSRIWITPSKPDQNFEPTYTQVTSKLGKRYHTNLTKSFASSPSNQLTILKIIFNPKNFGIGFKESLWLVNQLKNIKRKPALDFLKRYEETLIYSKEWQAAFCLLSAVKVSTFSTYLCALKVFYNFLARPGKHKENNITSFETLIHAIKENKLEEEHLVAYILYRIPRVKFSTLRGNLTALSFFYRHVAKINFWNHFQDVQRTIHSCSAQWDENAEGSIYMTWNHMKKFLNHVFHYEFKNVDKQVMFDCFLLSFWFGFRISEACNIWFRSMCVINKTPFLAPQLRACIVGSKTNDNIKTPWHMVTLTSFPEKEWKYWCPLQAFKRLQKRRKYKQDYIFTRKDGKPFTKNWLDTTFRNFKNDFLKHHPDILSPDDKCTFHLFRISAMGFYIRELNLSIYETQSIIRHKLGSRTTAEIYLAKSLQEFNNTAANKILNYVSKYNQTPPDEKEFLINCNNAKLAKTFKVFASKSQSLNPPKINLDDDFFPFCGPNKTI